MPKTKAKQIAAPPLMKVARDKLHEVWGYEEFRKGQDKIISHLLAGDDVLAVLPTGSGKSICFQIPALCSDGTTVVISPLIALMKDQVDDLNAVGVPAAFINSTQDDTVQQEVLMDFVAGAYKLLYVAPERLRSKAFTDAVTVAEVNLLAVDEAHCVSQWGHDFRPAYQRIQAIVKSMEEADNRPPILACTATCPVGIEDDVAKGVGMDSDYVRIVADPIRPNFTYNVMHGNMWYNLTSVARQFNPETGRYLVYCITRRSAEIVANKIEDEVGKNLVAFYHAGMTGQDRARVQDQFKSGERPIVCATCAFGMGIDVPNIRAVVHCGVPGSIEDYTQEIGRGGRDGLSTTAWLLFDPKGLEIRQQFIDNANPPFEYFGPVWDYLKYKTKPGEILRESGETIADNLKQLLREHELDDDLMMRLNGSIVRSVLSSLESKGLVIRREARAGTHVRFNVAMMNERESLTGAQRKVADAMWADLADKFEKGGLNSVEDLVDLYKVAEATGMSYMPVKRAMLALQEAGYLVMEAKYTGKTTAVSPAAYKKSIEELVTKSQVEAKRDREIERLDLAVAYAHLRTEKERVRHIRNYFMGSPASGHPSDEASVYDAEKDAG